jgi:hypothetical protein
VLLESFHQSGEVQQQAAEAVDLGDDDAAGLAVGDVGEEALEGGRSVLPPEKPPSS